MCYNVNIIDAGGQLQYFTACQHLDAIIEYIFAVYTNFGPINIHQKQSWMLIIIDLMTFSSSVVNWLSC